MFPMKTTPGPAKATREEAGMLPSARPRPTPPSMGHNRVTIFDKPAYQNNLADLWNTSRRTRCVVNNAFHTTHAERGAKQVFGPPENGYVRKFSSFRAEKKNFFYPHKITNSCGKNTFCGGKLSKEGPREAHMFPGKIDFLTKFWSFFGPPKISKGENFSGPGQKKKIFFYSRKTDYFR